MFIKNKFNKTGMRLNVIVALLAMTLVAIGASSMHITPVWAASVASTVTDIECKASLDTILVKMEELATPKKIPKIFDDPEKQAAAERAAEREPALKEFFMGYPDNDGKVTGGYTKEELAAEHPQFLQYDTRWGYYNYGTDCMGFTGCAPTAMAMVALELIGDPDITPDVIAQYALEHGMYIKGAGTAWKFFTEAAPAFGLKGRILRFNEAGMKAELDAGHPIIISLGPGDFTKNGHIAVIASYNEDGFIVSDPGSTRRSKKTWSFERLIPQIKQLWVYTKL